MSTLASFGLIVIIYPICLVIGWNVDKHFGFPLLEALTPKDED